MKKFVDNLVSSIVAGLIISIIFYLVFMIILVPILGIYSSDPAKSISFVAGSVLPAVSWIIFCGVVFIVLITDYD